MQNIYADEKRGGNYTQFCIKENKLQFFPTCSSTLELTTLYSC